MNFSQTFFKIISILFFCFSIQLIGQTIEVFNIDLLPSLTINELKLTKKRLLRQKDYAASDKVDEEIKKRYKEEKQKIVVKVEEPEIVKKTTKKTEETNQQNFLYTRINNLSLSLEESNKKELKPKKTNIIAPEFKDDVVLNNQQDKENVISTPIKNEEIKVDKEVIELKEETVSKTTKEKVESVKTTNSQVNNQPIEKTVPTFKKELLINTPLVTTNLETPKPKNNNLNSKKTQNNISSDTLKIATSKSLNIKKKTIPQIINKKEKEDEIKPTIELKKVAFDDLIKLRDNLKSNNLNTSFVEDEIANRKTTGITETVIKKDSKPLPNLTIEQLQVKQNEAIKNKEFVLADTIEKQIIKVKSKPTITKIKIQQQEALAKKDYLLADKLEKQIQLIKQTQVVKLEAQIKTAINQKDYLLADKLEKQINKLKNKEETNKKLEEQKQDAIINKDYLLANKLENTVKNSKNKVNTTSNSLVVLNPKKEVKKGSNLRESSLFEIMSDFNNATQSNTTNSNSIVSFTSTRNNSKAKVRSHTSNANEINYRRSSLYTLMIENTTREHSAAIKNTFGNQVIQEKFNDHNIGPYLIYSNEIKKDQSGNISTYLSNNDIAKKMISKWFNRNEKGEFNMQLVAERGNYSATDLDVVIARNNERGEAMLADAGEDLIGNTFVIVNDYKYTNKEKVAKKTGGFLKVLSSVAAYVPGGSNISSIANYASVGVAVVGKGYVIKTTSYLYKLVWDEETAAIFYNDYWIDGNSFDEAKKQAFENSNIFKLKYIGSQNAWADIQSTAFSNKSNEQLIRRSTVKATNKAIAKLQRKYDKFKTKSPIIGVAPVTAKIGLKEGLEKGDKFEVLEQALNKNGKTVYNRVGTVSVDKRHIWDNRFMAKEENTSQFEYTTFKGKSKKFQVGMFLRQIN